MNAVLADPSAGHDDQIARLDALAGAGNAVDLFGQTPHGTAVNQRLADITVIEELPAVAVGNAALIAASIFALTDKDLEARLEAFRKAQTEKVLEAEL